jgi:hypothetical protein
VRSGINHTPTIFECYGNKMDLELVYYRWYKLYIVIKVGYYRWLRLGFQLKGADTFKLSPPQLAQTICLRFEGRNIFTLLSLPLESNSAVLGFDSENFLKSLLR